ncbi:hypothetical protein K474DRAFT_1634430 [Panus rudis PR-1116 ss-1]|nr:hypothetical protein K474DRAFT_1634430 [Panus rudis PR-1116 ss-1]
MDGWKDHLHFSLLGEHVLFPSLHLDTVWHFLLASSFTIVLCLSERTLTYAISKNWSPFAWSRRTRLQKAFWKACLYWVVTLGRLLYMLLAMTFNVGLILVVVTSLSAGQFVIEYLQEPSHEPRGRRDSENVKEPLLESPTTYEHPVALHTYPSFRSSPSSAYDAYSRSPPLSPSPVSAQLPYTQSNPLLPSVTPPRSRSPHSFHLPPPPATSSKANPPQITTRPRSKSKPTSIFIHPNESNLARADAAAQQLGLQGDTERVKASVYAADDDVPWEVGKGKDVARELLGRRKDAM